MKTKLLLMRVVLQLILTFLLLYFSSHSLKSQTFNGETPINIDCGAILEGDTWRMGNNFSISDYGDCLPDSGNAYEGEDLLYKFNLLKESDVRLKVTSNCPKAITLFKSVEGKLTCILNTELDGTAFDYLGGIRLNPGDYYFIIDERDGIQCNRFTVSLECQEYTPFTVCEQGGDLTSCRKTIRDTLKELPPKVVAEGNPVFNAADNTCDSIKSYKIYTAYFKNPQQIQTIITNANTNDLKVLTLTEDEACDQILTCMDDLGETPPMEEPAPDLGIQLLNVTDGAIGGFYYFVVIGKPGDTYDFQVVTEDCNKCGYDVTRMECGETITADAVGAENTFDNAIAGGIDAYANCYGEDRTYRGGDLIFEFEVDEVTNLDIQLTSFFDAGLFLFDVNCASDCLGYGETSGINGTTGFSDFKVAPGIYQIVVDLAETHPAGFKCPFTLSIVECEKVEMPFTPQLIEATPVVHEITLRNSKRFKKNDQPINNGDIVLFVSEDPTCGNYVVNRDTIESTNSKVDVYGRSGNLRGYRDNDKMRTQYKIGTSVEPVDPVYANRNKTDDPEKFMSGGKSTLKKVSSLETEMRKRVKLEMKDIDRIINDKELKVSEVEIFANTAKAVAGRVDWCISINRPRTRNPDQIRIIDPVGSGNKVVQIEHGPNDSAEDRVMEFILTNLASGEILPFKYTQLGNCDDDQPDPSFANCPSPNQVTTVSKSTLNDRSGLKEIILGKFEDLDIIDVCNPEVTKKDISVTKIEPHTTFPNRYIGTLIMPNHSTTCLVHLRVDDDMGRIGNFYNNLNFSNSVPIKVFPNPNNGNFDLALKSISQAPHEVQIINTFGQQIKRITLTPKDWNSIIPIELGTVESGIFYIHLRAGRQSYFKKMVIIN